MRVDYKVNNNILYIEVDWKEFKSTSEMIDTVKKVLPAIDVVRGKPLKIKGKFPYQLGMFLMWYYGQVVDVGVYDPQVRDYYFYR